MNEAQWQEFLQRRREPGLRPPVHVFIVFRPPEPGYEVEDEAVALDKALNSHLDYPCTL